MIFPQYIGMDHLRYLNYKNEHSEIKNLNIIRKYRLLKAENNILELGKHFKEL